MSKLCQNNVCLECMKFSQKELEQGQIPDLIKFGCKMGLKFGDLIEENGSTKLYFAPAGNYPPAPKLVICGLATSPQAKEYLKNCGQKDCKEVCRRKCLESVYQGDMLYRLALILRFFFYNNKSQKLIWPPLEKFKLKNGQKVYNFLAFCRELPARNRQWRVVQLPDEIQFTQMLCCLTENDASFKEKANFKEKWLKLARDCLLNGYLKALISLWQAQKIKTIIFLGRRANQNYPLYKYLKTELGVKLTSLYNGYYARKDKSYILFVDHPSPGNGCFPKWFSFSDPERDDSTLHFDSKIRQYYRKLRCDFIRQAFRE